jgi:hypothetical protein
MKHFSIGTWSPGIGDPSFMGWFTVFSYYITAGIILLSAFRSNSNNGGDNITFKLFIFASMAFLGLCKQYDLPSAITEIGKLLFNSEGWIEKRRIAQVFMIAGFCVVLFSIATILLNRLKQLLNKRCIITLVFFLYLFAFVAIRAISLHQYETLLDYKILGLRLNYIGELAGIYGVCFSMLFGSRSTPPVKSGN